jgi:hypothetical protein
MSKTLEGMRETLTGQPRRRWWPWRRKTLAEQVIEKAEQVGEAASDLASRATELTTDLAKRATAQTAVAATGVQRHAASTAGKVAERFSGRQAPGAEEMPGDVPAALVGWHRPMSSAADVSAERAALAAEAASAAAQRAVGLMERMGRMLRVQASRTALPSAPLVVQAPQSLPPALVGGPVALPEAPLAEGEEQVGPGRKAAGKLKHAVTRVGERINELSDGRYGLEAAPTKKEKKAAKQLQKQERKAAKQAETSSRMSGLAWAIGLSLGLMIGLLGVAYWQRRRLQKIWGETSQRMQQATEELRQRFDAQRRTNPQFSPPVITPEARETGQAGTGTSTATFTQFGSSTPVTDLGQQTNGKVESST